MARIMIDIPDNVFRKIKAEANDRNCAVNIVAREKLILIYDKDYVSEEHCLKELIEEAIEYARQNMVGTRFTINDLSAIGKTELLNKNSLKRSAQRPAVTKKFISAIKDGSIKAIKKDDRLIYVACLVDDQNNAVKTNRTSTFIIVDNNSAIVRIAEDGQYISVKKAEE